MAMDETARRRARRAARMRGSADRQNAAAALQRALDRRDNGGVTGHGEQQHIAAPAAVHGDAPPVAHGEQQAA